MTTKNKDQKLILRTKLEDQVEALHRSTRSSFAITAPVHEKLREKSSLYRNWHQKKWASSIHAATAGAFVVSFIISLVLQMGFPLFSTKPNSALAGSTSVTWTSQADFTNNNGATGTTTQSQVDLTTSPGDVALGSADTSVGKMLIFWDGTTAPSGWDIVSDAPGEAFYQKFIRGATTYNATGGGNATVLHTFSGNTSTATQSNFVQTAPTITVGAPNTGHAVTGSTAAVSVAPPYRNLKVLRYTGSEGTPATIPANAIAMFSSVPVGGNWSRYSTQDNLYVYGEANNTGTGGSATHSHSITSATFGAVSGVSVHNSASLGYGTTYLANTSHSHSITSTNTDSVANDPSFNTTLLYKTNSDVATPLNLIAMFDDAPATSWTSLSGGGGVFNNKLIKGSATYNIPGGSDAHAHANVSVATGNSTGTGSVHAIGDTCPCTAVHGYDGNGLFHSHGNFTATIASASSLPPYIDVIIAQKTTAYSSPGTIGGVTAGNVGLRVDAGSGLAVKATSLTWNATTGSAGQKVLFKVRAGDTQAELDANQCYGPTTLDSGCADWATAGKFFSQINGQSNSATTIPSGLASKRYIEVLVRLESGGSNTPTLNDVTLSYDSLEAPVLANSTIYKSDGTTQLSTGGTEGVWTNETSVKVTTTGLTCTGCGTSNTRKIEVEVKLIASAFDGTGTVLGDYNDTTFASTATVTGLSAGSSYHTRLRTTDAQGRVSGWTSYGSGSDTPTAASDFSVDQGVPTTPGVPSTTSPTSDTTPTWSWTASTDALSGLATTNTYKVYWDTVAGGTTYSAFSNTNSFTHSTPLAEGTWYLKVEAYDKAGNVSSVSGNGSVMIDLTNPAAFELSTPANNSWTNQANPTLSWGASSDANGLAKYQLYVDGGLDTDSISGAATSQATTGALTSGAHTWYVKAVDNATNVTQSTSTYTLGYDNLAPSLALDPGFTFTASDSEDATVILSWGAYADDSGVTAPVSQYSLERLRYAEYLLGSHNLTSNWALGGNGAGSGYSDLGNTASTSYIDSSITASTKYMYRVKVTDTASNVSNWLIENDGMTRDSQKPNDPSSVTATACDGTAPNCSNVANKGYEIKLSWSPASDSGTGVTGYKIYRIPTTNSTTDADFKPTNLVGYLDVNPPGAPISTVFYDNDTNNDLTFTDATFDPDSLTPGIQAIKPSASARVNDYEDYFYRITGIDEAGNESDVITRTLGIANTVNYATAKTPDVTAPSVPASVVATPLGLDSSGDSQQLSISWSPSTDTRTVGRVPTGNGSGIAGYKVYRCEGSSVFCADDGNYALATWNDGAGGTDDGIATTNSYTDKERSEFTEYYYKIVAVDQASSGSVSDASNNSSARSSANGATTFSNTVPTVPIDVTVTTKTGNAANDPDVGFQNTITFKGAYAKNCSGGVNCIVGYGIYRSQTNYASDAQWLSGATLLANVSLTAIQDERTVTYTYVDNNATNAATTPSISRSSGAGPVVSKSVTTALDDSNTYYYKVRSIDNTVPTALQSGLSVVTVGSLHAGWDTTADATKQTELLEVKVKDIHGATDMARNIVTWVRQDDTDSQNQRNSVSDFKEYRVYRYTTDPLSPTLIATKTDINDNYFVDGFITNQSDPAYINPAQDFNYYVVAVDTASTFAYGIGGVINAQENISSYAVASLNPSIAKPTVSSISVSSKGVSTATISWNTNQSTDSLVEYRVKDSSDVVASGKDRTTMTSTHSVDLKALAKGTTYQYRVVSRNNLGNIDETAASTWQEFTTDDFSISNISVDTTTTTATITWTTNSTADSTIEFSADAAPGEGQEASQVAGDPALVSGHSVTIKALKPNREYTYKVRSVTGDKYVAETAFAKFKTKPFDASQFVISPNASNISEKDIKATSAKLTWTTSIATTSWVDYGTQSGNYTNSAGDNKFNTTHVVEVQNLTPGQKYYYVVRGEDTNKIEYISQEYTFTAVLLPEAAGVKVANVTHNTATITWTTNTMTDSLVEYGESTAFGLSKGDPTLTKEHSVTLDNLSQNKTHYFRVVSVDSVGNKTTSANSSFVTQLDTIAPKIENVKQEVIRTTDSSGEEKVVAIVSWSTDEEATSQVEFGLGLTGTYTNLTIEDTSLKKSHSIIVSNLRPASTYHFRVISADSNKNQAKSDNNTMLTPAKQQSIFQKIIKALEESFAWVNNLRTFITDKISGLF